MPIGVKDQAVIGMPLIKIEQPSHAHVIESLKATEVEVPSIPVKPIVEFGPHLLPLFTTRELFGELYRRLKLMVREWMNKCLFRE